MGVAMYLAIQFDADQLVAQCTPGTFSLGGVMSCTAVSIALMKELNRVLRTLAAHARLCVHVLAA